MLNAYGEIMHSARASILRGMLKKNGVDRGVIVVCTDLTMQQPVVFYFRSINK